MATGNDRWREIDQLFDAVLGVEPSQRAPFLDKHCTDEEVRQQVEQLLVRVDTHADFLQTGGGAAGRFAEIPEDGEIPALEPSPMELKAGHKIHGFRLIEQAGTGGMGEVWKAEQLEPVRRLVALKLIKAGMDTKEVVGRFESERQALAIMNHPNIARVFDGGVSELGRPYFVMELVRGIPITEYCDLNRLAIGERIDLFLQVCSGVQHAHHKGIIHRDIKPSNVLVTTDDGPPTPKIIDFGVARAMDYRLSKHSMHTRLGEMIGTPGYMSPEQIEMGAMDVDTRTDVYSLGVLFYELLTGLRPLDLKPVGQAGSEDFRRAMRDHDPQRPSVRVEKCGAQAGDIARQRRTEAQGLIAELRGDLDWIAMKALEKDRTARYDSPHELAADLERFKNDEPVEASPPSALYRLEKFARRNKTAFALSASIVFGIVAATVALSYALVESNRQRAKTEAALAVAERARNEAETIAGFLEDMLGSARPGRGGRDVTVREILDNGARTVDARFDERTMIEARLRSTMGVVYHELGYLDEARPFLETSVDLAEELLGLNSPELPAYLDRLANFYSSTGKFAKAKIRYRQAQAILQEQDPVDQLKLASSFANLSALMADTGEHKEAAKLLEQSLEIQREQFGEDHAHAAGIYNNIAILLKDAGDLPGARSYYEQAIALSEANMGSEHPWYLSMQSNLAGVMVAEGNYEDALALDLEVLAVRERTLGTDHPDVALSLSNLAELYMLMGDQTSAREHVERALEIREAKLGTQHPRFAASLRVRASILSEDGQLNEAREDLERALEIDESQLGREHISVHEDVGALLAVLRQLGDIEAARSLRQRFPGVTVSKESH